ncbi:DUF1128 domain-containing protein [Thalassobacillus sp. CUG 92003]|uniref:DUF1128 domain-containing protein n=1 Tax=Thalassobacillus sp. CUG 92003 TaxID=2736641 RepID=UPI0015E711B5|nr:DUF1128 domain-containing protein [Thalassobacillus sp. CUG 92003]
MDLNEATEENLAFIIDELATKLAVVNRSIMDAKDYDLAHYNEIKSLYDMVLMKGQLSVPETQAFIQELGQYRKA